jgi:hypothetical protein
VRGIVSRRPSAKALNQSRFRTRVDVGTGKEVESSRLQITRQRIFDHKRRLGYLEPQTGVGGPPALQLAGADSRRVSPAMQKTPTGRSRGQGGLADGTPGGVLSRAMQISVAVDSMYVDQRRGGDLDGCELSILNIARACHTARTGDFIFHLQRLSVSPFPTYGRKMKHR